MSKICRRCGKCCLYVPWLLRNVPNARQERCPHLEGEIGNTTCAIYDQADRLGREIAPHVFCGARDPKDEIAGCTYCLPEPHIRKTISIGQDNIGLGYINDKHERINKRG